MSVPSPLDQLGGTPFSFYPPIVNIEHNEWIFRRATWSEVQVMNTKSSIELWVSRRFLGEVSLIAEPVIIVGLIKELEYKAGALYPHVRHVIEMPRAVNESRRRYARAAEPERPAPVVGIRLESGIKSRAGRAMLGMIAIGILICVGGVLVFRDVSLGSRVNLFPITGVELPLTVRDDYDSIVRRLGPPAEDRWQSGYRRLWYPRRSYAIILRGDRYIGAVDQGGRVIHSVVLPDGGNSAPVLKHLP